MTKRRVAMEKKMNNRRYRKTEEAILKVFFEDGLKAGYSMQKIAKEARISRGAIYIHHHAIREIIPDYQRYILIEYRRTLRKKLRGKNPSLRNLYLETLLFILQNRRVFEMFLNVGNREVLIRIIESLKGEIVSYARLPKDCEKVFWIYSNEVVGVIEEWGQKGFPRNQVEETLNDIIYLTKTSRERLMPINK